MKGGRWVIVLNAGTATNTPRPKKNMVFLSKTEVENPSVDSIWAGAMTLLPRNIQPTTNSGAKRLTTEGKNRP